MSDGCINVWYGLVHLQSLCECRMQFSRKKEHKINIFSDIKMANAPKQLNTEYKLDNTSVEDYNKLENFDQMDNQVSWKIDFLIW